MTLAQPTIPGIDLTPTGVTVPLHQLDTPALVHACGHLAGVVSLTHWALGDLVVELWARQDAAALQALSEQGHDQATIARAIAVSAAIPPARRRDALSWSHHEVVAKLIRGDDQQDTWLDRAVRDRLTVRQLRDAITTERDAAQGQIPGVERLPRPPESRLRAALRESPVVLWIPGRGQLSAAHIRAVDVIAGQRVAVVTVDAAMASILQVEDAA